MDSFDPKREETTGHTGLRLFEVPLGMELCVRSRKAPEGETALVQQKVVISILGEVQIHRGWKGKFDGSIEKNNYTLKFIHVIRLFIHQSICGFG